MSALLAAIDAHLPSFTGFPEGVHGISIDTEGRVLAHPGWHGIDDPRSRFMGKGTTAAEAVADLLFKLAAEDAKADVREQARAALVAAGLDPALVSA